MTVAVSRILVPVDFSPHADVAFRYATTLAGRLEAPVELLHVVDSRTDSATAEDRLGRYRDLAAAAGVRTATTVRAGQPANTIVEYAATGGIALIVMGTHGRRGLPHQSMGSVAEHVIRHATCPVITLRDFPTGDTTHLAPKAHPAALGYALGHFGTSRE